MPPLHCYRLTPANLSCAKAPRLIGGGTLPHEPVEERWSSPYVGELHAAGAPGRRSTGPCGPRYLPVHGLRRAVRRRGRGIAATTRGRRSLETTTRAGGTRAARVFEVCGRRRRRAARRGGTPSRPSTARLHRKRCGAAEKRDWARTLTRSFRKGVVVRAQPRADAGARAARARACGRAAPEPAGEPAEARPESQERPASQEKAEKPGEPKSQAARRRSGRRAPPGSSPAPSRRPTVRSRRSSTSAAAAALEDEAAKKPWPRRRRPRRARGASSRLRRGAGFNMRRWTTTHCRRKVANGATTHALSPRGAAPRDGLRLAPRGPGAWASWPGVGRGGRPRARPPGSAGRRGQGREEGRGALWQVPRLSAVRTSRPTRTKSWPQLRKKCCSVCPMREHT